MIQLKDLVVGQDDKVFEKIVEKFIRESEILELMQFDDTVSPSGKGSTMVYTYVQEKLPSMAAFRAIGQEYEPNEGTLEDKSVKLKIFGGAFEIDRVIKTIEGKKENMARQIDLKTVAAVQLFHDKMINGDIASDEKEFDGLDKMLVGTENEMNTDAYIDLSTMEQLKANADVFYEALTNLINSTNADAIMCNKDMKTKIQTVARVLGYKTESEDAFGRKVESIGSVRIVDLKNKYTVTGEGDQAVATKEAIIPANKERTLGGSKVTGLTDIYAVKFDIDEGFHGASVAGDKVINKYLPDFTTPGAVKKGEVEMVAAPVLKNTANAGILRNIKINK